MKTTAQPNNPLLSDLPYSFIHLKSKIFAEYNIVYHINNCYSIDQLSQVKSPHQLLFQKFSNQIQQMNLVIVDSIFPIVLSDVAAHTLTENISSLQEYIDLKRFFIAMNPKYDKKYYTYKFKSFLNHLLFSNIASGNTYKGHIETDKVYCRKNSSLELEYFPIFRQFELQEMLLEEMQLKINLKESSISKRKAILNFQIFIP